MSPTKKNLTNLPSILGYLDDFDDYINGARDICNLVSKANGWRDTNEIIIKYIKNSFTINQNFSIFLQTDIVPISEWFICYEMWHDFP